MAKCFDKTVSSSGNTFVVENSALRQNLNTAKVISNGNAQLYNHVINNVSVIFIIL
jgi:hypothetical protein